MCVNNLPRVALGSVVAEIRTRDLLSASNYYAQNFMQYSC